MSELLYQLALKQRETHDKFGLQARSELSDEETAQICRDYVRVSDERFACAKLVNELSQDKADLQERQMKLGGEKGVLQRKLNKLDKMIEAQLDTIHELTAQLDARDVQ